MTGGHTQISNSPTLFENASGGGGGYGVKSKVNSSSKLGIKNSTQSSMSKTKYNFYNHLPSVNRR